jgi:hypothetical protein
MKSNSQGLSSIDYPINRAVLLVAEDLTHVISFAIQ